MLVISPCFARTPQSVRLFSARMPKGLLRACFTPASLLTACALSLVVACGDDSSSSASKTLADGGSVITGTHESDGGMDSGSSVDDTPTSTVSTSAGACPNPTVQLAFSPMYSAFIPGSTTHTFQVPAVTDDGSPASWSVSDPTQAQLVAQNFNGLSGVMITIQGTGTGAPGQLTVIAIKDDGSCGTSVLNITSTTEDDWQIGDARYNDGVSLTLTAPTAVDGGAPGGNGAGARPDGGARGDGGGFRTSTGGSFFERDGGTACTNCHGPTATNGPYKDVSHTPEQTGGFSDDELIQIITKGEIPDGGYFDPTVIISNCDGGVTCTQRALQEWHAFHQWSDITPDQYPGIIAYLRSLQPEDQTGSAANFGGGGRRGDGGVPVRRADAGRP